MKRASTGIGRAVAQAVSKQQPGFVDDIHTSVLWIPVPACVADQINQYADHQYREQLPPAGIADFTGEREAFTVRNAVYRVRDLLSLFPDCCLDCVPVCWRIAPVCEQGALCIYGQGK